MKEQDFEQRSYFCNNRFLLIILFTVDYVGNLLFAPIKKRQLFLDKNNVRKILISRPDHMGDVLMLTAILPMIANAYPKARIDILIGSWAEVLVKNNSYISKCLLLDNCYLNRGKKNIFVKVCTMLSQLPGILLTLRRERYDIGIEFRPFFGNNIFLFLLGGVRYRVGYATGGCGFVLHKTGRFDVKRHFVENMRKLLRDAGVKDVDRTLTIQYTGGKDASFPVLDRLQRTDLKKELVVLHPGSGDQKRLWETAKWAALGDALQEIFPVSIVITGIPGERRMIEDIAASMNRKPLAKLCTLSIDEYFELLRRSRLLIGLESFSAHAAAAVRIPSVIIHCGIANPAAWKPWGSQSLLVTNHCEQSPCYDKHGCKSMNCIKGVEVDDVMRRIKDIFLSGTNRA